ncbi:MAG TPA: hypothetical protein DEB40_14320 [Elusimicrobia bacterium]|nr:hypothetical protein [Elusimicrobiota bacterium]HBT62908.1 hypothetical protein [Elusimicrobiota bacterium]
MKSAETVKLPGISQRIETLLLPAAREARVDDVRIGLGYTAVLLDEGRLGVAYTFRHEAQGGCCVFEGLRPISGRPASDLLALIGSSDRIEAAVGLACANALANRSSEGVQEGDVLGHLGLRREDCVAMVGCFSPLVGPIQERVKSLTVFDLVDRPTVVVRPAAEAADALPRCQIALITATAIINHTMDALLHAAANCREVAVLGPSTPMLPGAFGATNVTLLSGVVANRPKDILQVVSEGGGMRQFGPCVRKVSLRIPGFNKN